MATQVNLFAREDVNASTPPLHAARIIVALAATKQPQPRFIAVHDAHVAFFHAEIDEWIVVIPPRGLRRRGVGWQLLQAMYGTRRAGQLWQEFLAKSYTEANWVRIAVCAGAYYSKEADVTSCIHGDDFLSEGTWDGLDDLDQLLAASVYIKSLGRCGPGGASAAGGGKHAAATALLPEVACRRVVGGVPSQPDHGCEGGDDSARSPQPLRKQ